MNTDLEDPNLDPQETPEEEVVETRYRAVNGYAVTSFVLGVLSALTVVTWELQVLPALGVFFAWVAFRVYRRNPEEQTGMAFAKWGLALSLGLAVAGASYQLYVYYTQAPPGYERISFKMLQPERDNPNERFPPVAEDLDKKRVYMEGYIRPIRQSGPTTQFLLVQYVRHCQFCSPMPKPTELILVQLKGSRRVELTTYEIGVAGVFTLHTDPSEKGMGGLPYKIEAEIIK